MKAQQNQEQIEQVEQMLIERLSELLEDPMFREKITSEANLIDAGMNSIMMVRLIVDIEQHFEVVFEDEEMLEENFITLHQIASNILRKLGQGT
ncbi:acyl carrier protein [Cohnella faecalis]|uniref:Acyl carrier protein n=1 Tax=Cohnella faecalis TaxID=2315694 RepID=A0A398CPF4_9BACL|nr:acyl carrier protein [Cohnella faecalis]RIE00814.1 acyl carrier protein [Cohnella faecalis]